MKKKKFQNYRNGVRMLQWTFFSRPPRLRRASVLKPYLILFLFKILILFVWVGINICFVQNAKGYTVRSLPQISSPVIQCLCLEEASDCLPSLPDIFHMYIRKYSRLCIRLFCLFPLMAAYFGLLIWNNSNLDYKEYSHFLKENVLFYCLSVP